MNRNHVSLGHLLAVWLILLVAGCGPPPDQRDVRLAEFARESVDQQARQNEALARQSEAVISESREVTVAARELVEKDAEARREMVAAQRELQQEVLRQQAKVDSQRDQLEAERRQLAQQRGRDPIIAAAIQSFAGLLACLLPLLLCAVLLYRMSGSDDEREALGELLVHELTSQRPLGLSGPETDRPLGLGVHKSTVEADEGFTPF